MTDYKPQDQPNTIKRLSFEELGGDDYSRYDRVRKGIVRECVTPKFSVPLSREGTKLHEYVDRNEVKAAIRGRNELIRLIVFWYPVVDLENVGLSYINDNTAVKDLFNTKYLSETEAVSPKVYYDG